MTLREARFPDLVEQLIALVTERQGHRLAARVEEAKVALSEAPQTQFRFATPEVQLATEITLADLTQSIARATTSIADAAANALAAAGVGAERIETLILTGGSTQIPAILTKLRALFPAARFVDTDAFGSVGLGLALDARRKFG